MEAVAAERRALPEGPLIEHDYVFDGLGADGRPAKIRLSELFAPGKDTLLVYNFMFPRHNTDDRPRPTRGAMADVPIEQGPCPSCTGLLDQFDGAAEALEAAGFNMVIVAKAPIERVIAFAKDRGWRNLRLVSSAGNDFKRDFHGEFDDGQMAPMMNVFRRGPDGIRHFWSSEMLFADSDSGQDPRHMGTVEPLWTLMDFTPEGRPNFDEQMQYDCCHGAKPGKAV